MSFFKFSETKKKVTTVFRRTNNDGSHEEVHTTYTVSNSPSSSPGPLTCSLPKNYQSRLNNNVKSLSSDMLASECRQNALEKAIPDVQSAGTKRQSSGTGDEFSELCLKKHNFYREKHGVPPLKLNKQLSKFSQEWASILASKGKMEHRSNNKYGENLYFKWSSDPACVVLGDEAVDSWYSEISKYIFGKEGSISGTGHFTQVVWRDSTELGVGIARNRKGEIYIVCNYNPAGNFIGKFRDNVPRPIK